MSPERSVTYVSERTLVSFQLTAKPFASLRRICDTEICATGARFNHY